VRRPRPLGAPSRAGGATLKGEGVFSPAAPHRVGRRSRDKMRGKWGGARAGAAAAAVLVAAMFLAGGAAALFPRPPGGGNGPEWSKQTNAIPCNIPGGPVDYGSCFVWSENLWDVGPYLFNVTDYTDFPAAPSNVTFTGHAYGIWSFTNSTGTYAINHTLAEHIFVDLSKPGTLTIYNDFYFQECSNSTCWWNETVSHFPMEAPWNPADCTIAIGCNPD
jgi:hypothetical protein